MSDDAAASIKASDVKVDAGLRVSAELRRSDGRGQACRVSPARDNVNTKARAPRCGEQSQRAPDAVRAHYQHSCRSLGDGAAELLAMAAKPRAPALLFARHARPPSGQLWNSRR